MVINLADIEDEGFRREMEAKAGELLERGVEKLAELQAIVGARTGDV